MFNNFTKVICMTKNMFDLYVIIQFYLQDLQNTFVVYVYR